MKAASGSRLGSKLPPRRPTSIDAGGVYSMRDACRLLHKDHRAIREEVQAGRLRGRMEKGQWLFLGQSLIDWVLGKQP